LQVEALQQPLHLVDFRQRRKLDGGGIMLVRLDQHVPIVLLFWPAIDVNGLVGVPADHALNGRIVETSRF
jgi:hypothetical protein